MDLEKQKLLIDYLVSDKDLLATCNSIIKPVYFDPAIRKVVAFVQDYFEKYKDVPGTELVKAETNVQCKHVEALSKDKHLYTCDEVEKFCRNKAVELAILNSVKLLDKQDFGQIEQSLKDAISVGLVKDLGLDYFADPEKRLLDTEQTMRPISTGWPELDEHIGGGLFRQELTLFMANCVTGNTKIRIRKKQKR